MGLVELLRRFYLRMDMVGLEELRFCKEGTAYDEREVEELLACKYYMVDFDLWLGERLAEEPVVGDY